MKKLISLILALLLLVTTLVVMPLGVSAAATFRAGDELYLKIENPTNWADGAILYVNFTDASREENNSQSVVIATADKSRYNPATGVTYDSARRLYKYTVTAADAGATAMRFWRGNEEKLWNDSVVLSAEDYAEGKNTAVITDWTATGYLSSTYDYELSAQLKLSATTGEVGDSFDISVTHNTIPNAEIAYEISINDEKVADTATYTFTPEENGAYNVKAVVTATSGGKIVAFDTKTASITVGSVSVTAFTPNCLYAHAAVDGADDSEAWIKWYNVGGTYYFFMPSSAKAYDSVELYSTLTTDTSMNDTAIPANGVATFPVNPDSTYTVNWNGSNRTVKFMFSSAEAALWVNNTDDFGGFDDFFAYLKADKSNSVAASGAVSTPDGKIENTEIKKMKGRGNTSWNAAKKGFNVTFQNAIQLAGIEKCKKFSLISNFQDAAMARNRVLYDLADAVGTPYSSDSCFIDLYTNGVYQGTYQMCQKIDVGKNTLINDFEADDYLDSETGNVKSDFCYVAEIDASPAADDFTVSARNGNNLTMKAPELDKNDPNYNTVRSYVRTTYNYLYTNLQKESIVNYLDITSMAKVYIINELGKNWDTGASSFYFTYKPDKDGNYKFFAGPVWDYDNSLGNARGVSGDLNRMGITDYTLPTGWFASKKGGYVGPNVLAESVKNPLIMAEVRRVWFEDFLPALETLTSKNISSGEIYSSDVYADILRDTAAMNYKIWALDTNGSWTADHGSLTKYSATYTKNAYGQVTGVSLKKDSSATRYDQYTFDGQMDYMMDWTTSRAAWMSAQYIADYVPSTPSEPPTEAPTEAPTLPPEDIINPDLTNVIAAWIFDATDKAEGDKLNEYGNADDGYAATIGNGTMTLSVSGDKLRALEWSTPEYGKSGTLMTPIMAAGSKNQWGEPYINLNVPTRGYDAITLTAYIAGSNKAPATWKLQYSIDGKTYTDIENAQFSLTVENRKVLTAYFNKSDLPDFSYSMNDESVNLRLVPVDMTTVNGGNALENPSSGEIAINNIVVQGHKVAYEDVIMGDANSNGKIDIIDATIIQRYIAIISNLTSRQLVAADVNRNGTIEITDVTIIQRKLAGISQEYLN